MRWFFGLLIAAAFTIPSQLRYNANVTGSVSRPISSKEGDVVSACDFIGAVCPSASAATNTAGIQAALTYVGGLSGGGTVILPAGAYSVNPTLVMGLSNVTLRGMGGANTVLTGASASGGSAGVITVTAGGALSKIRIQDLGITCTGTVLTTYASGSGTYNNYGIYTGADLSDFEFSGLSISACGAGIATTYPTPPNTLTHNGTIHHNFIYGLSPSVLSTHVGIQIIGDHVKVTDNYASGFTVAYNSPPWSHDNTWTNNDGIMPANGNDVCIYLSGAFKSVVANNHCFMTLPVSTTGDGCIKMGAFNDPHVSDMWTVANNYCENGSIKMSRCQSGKIVGNTINGSGGSGGHAIFNDTFVFSVWNIQSITANTPSAGIATVVVNSATSSLVAPVNITIAGTASGHDGSHSLLGTGTNSFTIVDATSGNIGVLGTAKPFDTNGVDETIVYCKDMTISDNLIINAGQVGASSGAGVSGQGAIARWNVSSNIIKNPNGSGIDLRSGSGLIVNGNSISDTVNPCVYFDADNGGEITGNNCVQTGSSAAVGLRVGNTSSGVNVSGNTVTNYIRGIDVDTGTNSNLVIANNNLVAGSGSTRCLNADGSMTFSRVSWNNCQGSTWSQANVLWSGSNMCPGHVLGAVALTSATPSTATISLTNLNCITHCSCTNETTQANPVKCVVTAGTSLVITGPNTVTDSINYSCW